MGLGEYAEAFARNHIDAELLKQLTAEDLKDLGVASLGHRKRLLLAIADLDDSVGKADETDVSADLAPLGDRRPVTILFSDLSGFTALSETLDPEELHYFVGRYTALVDRVVEGYGGTVDKHIGDAVMALFGAPIAHGDDPLRAVRAALEIHAAIAGLSRDIGRPLEAHLGIASGEVVAAGLPRGGQQDYTVLGEAVNLAARLVALAQPGETLISDTVHRALSGQAECDAREAVAVKGLQHPIRLWNLRGLAAEKRDTQKRLVGRRAELEQFGGILSACLATGKGRLVYIRGDPGIGKTRLLAELTRLAKSRGFSRHEGLVLDFGIGRGQDAVHAVVRSLLDIEPGAEPVARSTAAKSAVAENMISTDQVVFLNDLLDLPQTGELQAHYDAMDNAVRNRGREEVIAALVRASSRRYPLLIAIEDLHWADAATLSFLAAIARTLPDGPALLVVTSRIEGAPLDRQWRSRIGGTPLTTIDLGPLDRRESLLLAGEFIDATQGVALACVERADGNPLFLEQLLRNAREGSEETLPGSIRSLVLARMDRLPPTDQQALQAASAIGQRFDLDMLRYLLRAPTYTCEGLVRNALVRPDGEAYLFGHALIQEGVYGSLLKARRVALHQKAAVWFEDRDPMLRAQHLDRAEDAFAAQAYFYAAQSQKSYYHHERALQLAERGLAIADTDHDRHALACLRGDLLQDLGATPRAIEAFQQALTLAPDDAGRCRAWIGVAAGLQVSDELDKALEVLDKAQEAGESQDMVAELARLHYLRGNVYWPLGRSQECREEHELSLAYAQRAGSIEAEARALGGLADAAFLLGRMRTGFGHGIRCIELARRHGFGRIELANNPLVGCFQIYLNQLREALERGTEAAVTAERAGNTRAWLGAEILSYWACSEMGEFDQGLAHIREADRLAQRLGSRRFDALTREFEGRILHGQGHHCEAMTKLRGALEIIRSAAVWKNPGPPRVIAALAVVTADSLERQRLLDEGEAIIRSGSGAHSQLYFYRDAMEATLAASDWAEALRYAQALEEYTYEEPLPWSDLFIARARLLAAVGTGQGGDALCRALTDNLAEIDRVGLRPFRARVARALKHLQQGKPTGEVLD